MSTYEGEGTPSGPPYSIKYAMAYSKRREFIWNGCVIIFIIMLAAFGVGLVQLFGG